MSTGVGCTVLLDGVRIADGSPIDDPTRPAALSGLSVTWGRDTTMDQPAMATCSFEVLDLPGGGSFVGYMRVGSRIDVQAGAVVYPDLPTISTFVDPGFDSGTFAGVPTNAFGTVVPPELASLRTNLAADPRGTTNVAAGQIGWTSSRWFGNGSPAPAGTHTRITGASDGPPGTGITSYLRKQWTVGCAALTNTGDTGFNNGNGSTNAVPVTPGQRFTFSSWLRASVRRRVQMAVQEQNGTTNGGRPRSAEVTAVPGVWTRVELTYTVPASGVTHILPISDSTASPVDGNTPWPAGSTLDGTGILVELAPGPAGRYFDGSTEDAGPDVYAWTGAPNASTSTATTTPSPYLRIMAEDSENGTVMLLAPAPFSSSPIAWDAIPATSLGQLWQYGVDVRAPLGAIVELRPVLFSSPKPGGGTTVLDVPISEPGDGSWHTVVGTFAPDVDGAWVGVEVRTYPVGPTWDEVPPALTWDQLDAASSWDDYGATDVDDVIVLAPDTGTVRTVDVFVGRITDIEASFDEGIGAPVIKVTAMDLIADLENRDIGDEPWPAERLDARAARIIGLAGLGTEITIAPNLAPVAVSWQDVDNQGAFGLLQNLAVSTDGVLWPAAHVTTGSYLLLEDTGARPALRELVYLNGKITIRGSSEAASAINLTACDLLRDPVSWLQSVSDVLTRAGVSWQEQGLDEDGNVQLTEHTVRVIDAGLETQFGTRSASVSTVLTTAADADAVADRLLGRSASTVWRAQGITLDDRWTSDTVPDDVEILLHLLDGTQRIGTGVVLNDMPGEWTPITGSVPVYVEGGDYTFEGGAWVLALTVSNSTGQGQSAAWDELDPAWSWDEWEPAITWNDLRGAAAPTGG